ncbi:type IV pilus assembly PilZ [Methylocella silvestris BL2]|uniref:Type IV pilus assembly PilZ n=1 Tax=Methylocella silvestris (strain DSM 15510 / CIP 108128 / LMG 27833 / NCIMB 13906 / BL2) TaxID=395965 RepID=B8EL45_METSB|nr:type IV pilus assembly PilZ [Methylocella silvestris]ACK49040.1 type IV pilus assembly PilZ [Methylocella silvestris BL2]
MNNRTRNPREDDAASGPLFEAAQVTHLDDKPKGDFAYCVRRNGSDRRGWPRRRTRLRSGKLLDQNNRFLIECQIYDRSDGGARLRVFSDVPPALTIRLYEDCPERLLEAEIVWREGGELGLRFIARRPARAIGKTMLTCLRDRYYAIVD